MLNLKDIPAGPMPHRVKPMLATLVDKPFDKKDWLFEIKWDGYRAVAEIEKGKVKLYSRNDLSFNELFASVVKDLEKLEHDAVLDGEVVILDKQGRSRFQLIQNYAKTGEGNLVYYVFDILYLDGHDLKRLPLTERRKYLDYIMPVGKDVKISEAIKDKGIAFFERAQEHSLEGILAKDRTSTYKPGVRGHNWLKIKTHQRQEAVIAGFTEPRGSRKHFGALVLGVYEKGELVYIGHTGGGFDKEKLDLVYKKMKPLMQKEPAFKNPPKTNMPVTWIKPKLVCEVSFSEWTDDGLMRQPIFVGMRLDKAARNVHRELPKRLR